MEYQFEFHDDIAVLTLSGDLIGENDGMEIIDKVNDVINTNISKCAIDISAVRYINSSGIGVLITALTKFRNKGGDVYLINPSEQVKKLLIVTKLNAIFNIVDTREAAMDKLAS